MPSDSSTAAIQREDLPEVWKRHPNGGIVCELHGRDPVRSHCVLCELEFDLLEEA